MEKDIIFNFINGYKRENHFTHCLYPEEQCSCKKFDNISYNSSLVNSGYLDSFNIISIVSFLEKNLKLKY